MSDSTSSEARECAQAEATTPHGLPRPDSHLVRSIAASPNKVSAIVLVPEKPVTRNEIGRKLSMSDPFQLPWTSTLGTRPDAGSSVPLFAQPLAASVAPGSVTQRSTCTLTPRAGLNNPPTFKNEIKISPVLRHGTIVSVEFRHNLASWLSSKTRACDPLSASRTHARYRNASPPCGGAGSTAR